MKAYETANLPPIRPAGDVDAVLAEIRKEISPLRLPAELERFWRRVDPDSITVAPYPRPTSPAFALRCWTTDRDGFAQCPRLLFPVAYESHGFLFVELEDGRGSGDVVLEWAYAGSPYYVRFPTLSAYVDLLATMIELEEFTRHQQGTHQYVEFDPEGRWNDAVAVRLSAAQPLHHYGHARELDERLLHWPQHWLVSSGVAPETRTLRGATTTVAELLEHVATTGAVAEGTLRVALQGIVGSAAGSRVSVSDGTGVLDVWCPSAVSTYLSTSSEFEFDVVVRPTTGPSGDWSREHGEIQSAALAGDIEGAQAAATELYAKAFLTPATAEATAIRPIV
ncbi:hypothetical protein [Cellulomonas sp. ICMP 17802]|uniref:hypothetical protein n=1 Tax=Cellulomonas sp. ICMP 17802 TaxID=3239199 RepID=UPI00351B3C3F